MSRFEFPTSREEAWPALPLSEWQPTCETLHMCTQIVGKVRLALAPPLNHWWHSTFYVNARGLTTSLIPYGSGGFEVEFDFLSHNLIFHTTSGESRVLQLVPRSVAEFYREFMSSLRALGIQVTINTMPQEVPNPIPLDQDETHASYDPQYANRFWRVLVSSARVMEKFRGLYCGKSSPVHFFWGSFDLAVTRFSGREAPPRKGADRVTQEAYSQEVISAGFWPGSGEINDAAFYAYASPEPSGFSQAKVAPSKAFYRPSMSEFFLMYEDVRNTASPGDTLMQFLQSTYEAGANLAGWDRGHLERRALAA